MKHLRTDWQGAAERFWRQVNVAGPDECWLWTGAVGDSGYGVFSIKRGENTGPHQFAYWLKTGKFPAGRQNPTRHTCDVALCCNMRHLLRGTVQQNVDDMVERHRQAHGQRLPWTKLSDAQVAEIQALLATGLSQRTVAKRYGVRQCSISDIARGNRTSLRRAA